MKPGRPSLYTPKLLASAQEYVELCEDDLPSIAGLALHLNIRRETCHVWAKEEGKEDFSNILEKILAKQEQKLLKNGLSGDYNSTITKLMLGKHGYSDKQETELTGAGGAPIEITYSGVNVSGKRPD